MITAYGEEKPKQIDRFDDLSKQLFKIQLATPGIYIGAVALAFSKQATAGGFALLAYGFWFLGILATMFAFFPKRYKVDPHAVVRVDGARRRGDSLTICEFYERAANWKYNFNAIALGLYLGGLASALVSLLQINTGGGEG